MCQARARYQSWLPLWGRRLFNRCDGARRDRVFGPGGRQTVDRGLPAGTSAPDPFPLGAIVGVDRAGGTGARGADPHEPPNRLRTPEIAVPTRRRASLRRHGAGAVIAVNHGDRRRDLYESLPRIIGMKPRASRARAENLWGFDQVG